MQGLRIGVNALYLIPGGVGGTEIYLRNLLKALAAIDGSNTYHVFTNLETDSELAPAAPNFKVVPQEVRGANRPMRLAWEQLVLPRQAARLQLDCLLNAGFTAPFLAHCPNITVFHDLQHKRHPEHFRWFDKPAWDLFLWTAVKGSQVLIADSPATKADLVHFYGLPESRVHVALLGVEDEFFSIAETRGPVGPYLLCVSTLHPHKNIERLIRVFARLRERRTDLQLVVAGLRGFRTPQIEQLIAGLRLEKSVRLTGWIPRQELYDLYRHAAAFVYPSTFEGFGLPVVEAMAAGVPMACSDIEPLRGIVADAAFRFDPHDDEAMLRAIECALSDNSLVEIARIRARDFTWTLCAERTLAAIQCAVNQRSRSSS
jgi:glycosyltransferase involved in cell wall biosynthesis